jgi:hypothetical protein
VCLTQRAEIKLDIEAIVKINNVMFVDSKKKGSQFFDLAWDEEFWDALEFHTYAEE